MNTVEDIYLLTFRGIEAASLNPFSEEDPRYRVVVSSPFGSAEVLRAAEPPLRNQGVDPGEVYFCSALNLRYFSVRTVQEGLEFLAKRLEEKNLMGDIFPQNYYGKIGSPVV